MDKVKNQQNTDCRTNEHQRYNIVLSYEWSKNDGGMRNNAFRAFKNLKESVNNRLKAKNKLVNYRRRGSAGDYLNQNIFNMICKADIIVVDITKNNQNVLLELGMSIAIQKTMNSELEIYLIRETQKRKNKIPSNLAGYFITEYSLKNKKISFNDANSLMMSISNHLKSKMQLAGDYELTIDELEEK